MSGAFAVSREVWDHPMFASEAFTEREAWVWLIGSAVWKARKVRVGRKMFALERGQSVFSIRFLAKRWRWSPARVHRFLDRLKSETMVETLACSEATQITVCNYDKYQFGRDTSETPSETPNETPARRPRDKEEELNKERIDIVRSEATDESVITLSPKAKRSTGIDPFFIEFYSAYPRRQSKQDAIKAYSQVLKTGVTHETIMRGLEAAKRVDRRFRDPQFTPLPASWLRAGGFEDEAGSTPQQDWKRAVFS